MNNTLIGLQVTIKKHRALGPNFASRKCYTCGEHHQTTFTTAQHLIQLWNNDIAEPTIPNGFEVAPSICNMHNVNAIHANTVNFQNNRNHDKVSSQT